MTAEYKVTLKRDGKVVINNIVTEFTWVNASGFCSEYILFGKNHKKLVNHYNRKTFINKVIEYLTHIESEQNDYS